MLWRKKVTKVHFNVKEASAARALFPEARGAIPKISLTFRTWDDEVITFEMEATEAGKLIEHAMSAYNAILPPLKTSRGGFGL